MIATSEGVNKVDVSFSFFSTISDSYKTSSVNSSILVEKSDSLTPAGDVFVGEAETYAPEKRTFNPGILYLRRYPAGKIFLPLTSNHKFAYWILGVFGPLSILISWLITRRNRQLANDPLLRRRRDAVAARGVIIRRLRKAPAENIDQVIQQQVVPFVNDMLSLPPGTSASELAEKVEDSDMRECLKNSGEASYMPGSGSMDKHELKECVIKAVKRFSIILLPVSYTHLRAHETSLHLVCRLLLEKKKTKQYYHNIPPAEQQRHRYDVQTTGTAHLRL
eukprot:TRINITY_DN15145_c0_g1_i2.p1 TRINITY_DN15145_c0_g1~~TRINITY_DN15145_c0_g1_i2.p1  ORF type:complete len:278 (+),score=43.93 TRINITY_DN15145_c0_g1_i2:665-1498(+)